MTDEQPNAYPLAWPAGFPRTPDAKRRRARFSAQGERGQRQISVAGAIRRLLDEVRKITRAGHTWRVNPDLVVISTNVRTRNDGLPYSNAAEPQDPGVAVYFHLDGVPHCLPCDTWDRVADNIVAIAKHLDAMRGMERWGVGDLRAAFAGFKQLPPGASQPMQTAFTVDQAAAFINAAAGQPAVNDDLVRVADIARLAYRKAAVNLHPDRGGDLDRFKALQEAKRVLFAHHGID